MSAGRAEAAAGVLARHPLPSTPDVAGCGGCDCEPRRRNSFTAEYRAHVAEALDRAGLLGGGDELRAHRLEWADWLSGWDGAVTPKRPTIQAVIDWLRADHLPFGCAANTEGDRP